MCAPLDTVPLQLEGAAPLQSGPCAGRICSGACKRLARSLEVSGPLGQANAPADDVLAQLPIRIADEFAAEILKPYRAHARYLKSAEITEFCDKAATPDFNGETRLIAARGRFAIPESCYIDDTGHFNAVEFNICFNQLAYVMFGKCIDVGLMHRLRREKIDVMSISDFKRQQLPAMVIVSIESRYYKQLRSDDFTGELVLNKVSSVGSAWFFFTTMTFADRDGVKAKGSVVLAYNPLPEAVRH